MQAVLLDIDGTLLRSNDEHALAWVDAFAEYGFAVTFATVRPLIGMDGEKLISTASGLSTKDGVGRAISKRRGEIFLTRYLRRTEPTRGSRALIQRFKANGLRCVVATSAQRSEMRALLAAAGVGDLLTEAVNSDDVDSGKPDPDIVRAALRRCACAPVDAILLGDTPYDIEAAGRAFVRTVAVRSGGWPDRDLHGALAVYDDPADLLRNYDASPFMTREKGAANV